MYITKENLLSFLKIIFSLISNDTKKAQRKQNSQLFNLIFSKIGKNIFNICGRIWMQTTVNNYFFYCTTDKKFITQSKKKHKCHLFDKGNTDCVILTAAKV